MSTIAEQEKRELRRLSRSSSLREDMDHLTTHRHNPMLADGKVDLDRPLDYLTEFNEFINHAPNRLCR